MAEVVLQTDRLTLRPPTADDFEAQYALTASDAMRRFLDREPPSREDSFNRLLRQAGCWALFGFGIFHLIEREAGAHVGGCGLFHGFRGLNDEYDQYPEAGWIIALDSWGRGYATEAMTAILAWFDATHGRQRTVCMIRRGNAASERIAAKLGYKPTGLGQYKADEMMLYARVAPPLKGRGWGEECSTR